MYTEMHIQRQCEWTEYKRTRRGGARKQTTHNSHTTQQTQHNRHNATDNTQQTTRNRHNATDTTQQTKGKVLMTAWQTQNKSILGRQKATDT